MKNHSRNSSTPMKSYARLCRTPLPQPAHEALLFLDIALLSLKRAATDWDL